MSSVEALFQKHAKKKEAAAGVKLDDTVAGVPSIGEAEKQHIQEMIEHNPLVLFSKSYCPYCRQAKMTLNSIENLEYKVVEMDDGNHEGWQTYIAQLAKEKAIPSAANNNTKSVPQIFINQQYIGGSDDLTELYTDKRLAGMLGCTY